MTIHAKFENEDVVVIKGSKRVEHIVTQVIPFLGPGWTLEYCYRLNIDPYRTHQESDLELVRTRDEDKKHRQLKSLMFTTHIANN